MPIYVQRAKEVYNTPHRKRNTWGQKTVGEFGTTKDAVKFLRKEKEKEPSMYFYLSTRPCKGWVKQEYKL